MLQTEPPSSLQSATAIKLEDFGVLQGRYQSLKLAERASAVLADAEPALTAADRILESLSEIENVGKMFDRLRKNHVITGKMRPSEAKQILMDKSNDYIETTRRKLAAWRKTLERIAKGEGVVAGSGKEYIQGTSDLAMAMIGTLEISTYLSVIQLIIPHLKKADSAKAESYNAMLAGMRRCATVLSDCEHASGLSTSIH